MQQGIITLLIYISPNLLQNGSLLEVLDKCVNHNPEVNIKLTQAVRNRLTEFRVFTCSREVKTIARVSFQYTEAVSDPEYIEQIFKEFNPTGDADRQPKMGKIYFTIESRNNAKLCNGLSLFIKRIAKIYVQNKDYTLDVKLDFYTTSTNRVNNLYVTSNVIEAIKDLMLTKPYTVIILDNQYAHIEGLELLYYCGIKQVHIKTYLIGYRNIDFQIFSETIAFKLNQSGAYINEQDIAQTVMEEGETIEGLHLSN